MAGWGRPAVELYRLLSAYPWRLSATLIIRLPISCSNYPERRQVFLYTIASAPTVTCSVFMQRFRLFSGQCSATNSNAKFGSRHEQVVAECLDDMLSTM